MISRMVERTNEQMRKVHEKINPNKFQFRYSDTSEEKNKCLFGLLHFRGLYHDTKQSTRELWYDNFSARNVYWGAMSLSRYERLMRTIILQLELIFWMTSLPA